MLQVEEKLVAFLSFFFFSCFVVFVWMLYSLQQQMFVRE